jgi:prepilin-type N-terminal cleavage/methylation domain-containing protein
MPAADRESSASRPLGPHSRPAAFTLIELLTVVAIIGILAAILIPTVGGVRRAALRAETKVRFSQWAAAMEQFRQEYGYYPAVTSRGGLLEPAAFLGALTAHDHLGAPVSGAALHGNAKAIVFHAVSEAEFARRADGTPANELVDAFGNSDIAILTDADGDGVIAGAELVRPPVRPGNSQDGFGAALTPPDEAWPATGIRASVVFYSAGAGGTSDDLVYSWK